MKYFYVIFIKQKVVSLKNNYQQYLNKNYFSRKNIQINMNFNKNVCIHNVCYKFITTLYLLYYDI